MLPLFFFFLFSKTLGVLTSFVSVSDTLIAGASKLVCSVAYGRTSVAKSE